MNPTELFKTEESARDLNWEQNFLTALPEFSGSLLMESPQNGPDGWPYLLVEIKEETAEKKLEPIQNILQWLSQRGIGLVINPQNKFPDYVLPYGMIWYFRETGTFLGTAADLKNNTAIFEQGQKVLAGPPTEDFLPIYVRKILTEFLRDQGVLLPRILVMSADREHYDLCFSLESLGNPPQQEHQGVLEAISWFLPPHYSITLVSEQGLPAFHSLS